VTADGVEGVATESSPASGVLQSSTCAGCGGSIVRWPSVGWVDPRVGAGAGWEFCPSSPGGHVPVPPDPRVGAGAGWEFFLSSPGGHVPVPPPPPLPPAPPRPLPEAGEWYDRCLTGAHDRLVARLAAASAAGDQDDAALALLLLRSVEADRVLLSRHRPEETTPGWHMPFVCSSCLTFDEDSEDYAGVSWPCSPLTDRAVFWGLLRVPAVLDRKGSL
jgi:hypothetical protein